MALLTNILQCGRCRKRKIKCSGDDGHGACSNCRNSGSMHQCQFLRVGPQTCRSLKQVSKLAEQVNSLSQEILSHPSPRWQVGIRYSPYHMDHHDGRHNTIAISHPYSASSNCTPIQPAYEYNSYTGATPATLWVRNHTGAAYGYSCDQESPIQYSSQPAFLLPSVESTANSSCYIGSPAGSRTWNPVTPINRGLQTTVYADQPVASSIAPLGSQFVSYTQGQTTMPCELPFPGVLSSNTNLITNDRVLPDPAASRSKSATNPTSIETAPMSLLQRSSNTWIEAVSGSSQSSSNRTLSISLSDESDSTARSVTSSAPQDMGFGFIPISNSSQEGSVQPTAALSAAETSQSAFEYPKAAVADYSKDRCRTLSRESVASSHDDTVAEGYGYSSESRSDHHPTHYNTTVGQLSNGQEYTRLRHDSPHVNSTLEEYQDHSPTYQTNLPHRTSIASISNSLGY